MLLFAYDFITPNGFHPNGVDIRFISEPQNYGRYMEGQYQAAFWHNALEKFFEIKKVPLYDLPRDAKFIYPLTTLGGADCWLGHPHYSPPNHHSLLSGVSREALQAQREGRCLFLIDQMWEGFCPVNANIFGRMQEDFLKHNLNLDNILYITSNMRIEELHAAWKASNQHSHNSERSFKVMSLEYFGDQAQARFVPDKNLHLVYNPYRPIEKDYVCFNRRTHSHRTLLVSELVNRDLIRNGYVSYPPKETFPIRTTEYEYPGYPNVAQKFQDLLKHIPFIVDKEEFIENHAPDVTHWPYDKSWFTVITETLYSSKQKTVFFSEKIYKPIAFLHPFIIVTQPYALRKLRELGYKTFSPFINEIYDEIEGDNDRMWAIAEEMTRLCKLTEEEKRNIIKDVQPMVEFNRNRLFTREPTLKQLESKLVDFVEGRWK